MQASSKKIREFPALLMTALFVGASLGTTGSLRTMTEQTSPNVIAERITQANQANRERKRPEKYLGFPAVAYAHGSQQRQPIRR